jgi:hypothetical protein
MWRRGCRSGTGYSAHASADRRSYAGTTPAAGDCADYSSGTGTNQTAAYRAIDRIVRVSEGRGCKHQCGADHIGKYPSLPHRLLTEPARDIRKQTNDAPSGSSLMLPDDRFPVFRGIYQEVLLATCRFIRVSGTRRPRGTLNL